VRIHDLASQNLLQSFYHMALIRGLGPNPPTAAYVNNVSLTMLVAVDSAVGVLEGKDDDITVLPFASHNRPINAILYNPLFKQVCSLDRRLEVRSTACSFLWKTHRKATNFRPC